MLSSGTNIKNLLTLRHLPHELKTPNVTDGTDYEHGNVKGCIASAHNSHGQKVQAIGTQYHVPKTSTIELCYDCLEL